MGLCANLCGASLCREPSRAAVGLLPVCISLERLLFRPARPPPASFPRLSTFHMLTVCRKDIRGFDKSQCCRRLDLFALTLVETLANFTHRPLDLSL